MELSYEPLRGFRDYIPPDSENMTWLCNTFAEVAKRFGYREVKTPTIESFQLFALKSGEEIRESMFVFKDKAGREVALRPEITPSIVRVYLKELRPWPKPTRIYYIGSVFRYDEPQFGRYREFTQAGVEIVGGGEIYYDVELIEVLEEFYDEIGLKDRAYKVNNIAVFRELAKRAGIDGLDLDRLLHYLDKGMYERAAEIFEHRNAREEAEVLRELASIGGESDKVEAAKNILSRLTNAEAILRHVETIEKYVEMVKAIGGNVVVEPSFARGIAYYTGIIFEVLVSHLSISIAGGGRYDELVQLYGGESTPATGFAIGVERTLIALTAAGLQLQRYRAPRTLLLVLSDELCAYSAAYDVAKNLRRRGIVVQLEISSAARLSRWLEYASKYGFDYVVIIGRRELEKKVATLRDMRRWVQEEVLLEEIPNVISLRATQNG